jgi:hypothetical protein
VLDDERSPSGWRSICFMRSIEATRGAVEVEVRHPAAVIVLAEVDQVARCEQHRPISFSPDQHGRCGRAV